MKIRSAGHASAAKKGANREKSGNTGTIKKTLRFCVFTGKVPAVSSECKIDTRSRKEGTRQRRKSGNRAREDAKGSGGYTRGGKGYVDKERTEGKR